MESFTTLTAIAAPFYVPDVNTDLLFPHRFMRKPVSAGYRNFLFHDVRFTNEGAERPYFVLNREPYRQARILIAGRNFGCGSARDPAVYALQDYGFRAVIAPSYADVFKAICLQNGFLPIELPEECVKSMCDMVEHQRGATVSIDLPRQSVLAPDGASHPFEIEQSRKEQFLKGLDDIGLTLEQLTTIESFENKYRGHLPWLAPRSTSS